MEQVIANGLYLGAQYAVIALGLTLIFALMNVLNFAHGQMYVLGGFVTYALARAVQFVHDHGILHRDLKPDNILLPMGKLEWGTGEEGVAYPASPLPLSEFTTPKITDFGLARRLGGAAGQTPSGWLIGTPGYMAPEQAAGAGKDVGPAADVWGLGAILYECLTGRPPFAGESLLEVLRQVADDDPVPPRRLAAGLPEEVEVICLKCLHKEAARRYASAAALAEALACLRGAL